MEYRTVYKDSIIGERIRAARKEAGYSQEALINELRMHGYKTPSRNTLSRAESGDLDALNGLPLGTIIGMSAILNCDPGYLLEEREHRYHEVEFVHKKTGLSVDAIFNIVDIQNDDLKAVLSRLIESHNLQFFLKVIEGIIKLQNNESHGNTPLLAYELDGHPMKVSEVRMLEWFFTEQLRKEINEVAADFAEKAKCDREG